MNQRVTIGAVVLPTLLLLGCGVNQREAQLTQQQADAKAGCDNGVQTDCILYEKILDYKEQRALVSQQQAQQAEVSTRPKVTNCFETATGVQCKSF